MNHKAYCDDENEFMDVCGNEAQHYYKDRRHGEWVMRARCEEHKLSPTFLEDSYDEISENEFFVAGVMES